MRDNKERETEEGNKPRVRQQSSTGLHFLSGYLEIIGSRLSNYSD